MKYLERLEGSKVTRIAAGSGCGPLPMSWHIRPRRSTRSNNVAAASPRTSHLALAPHTPNDRKGIHSAHRSCVTSCWLKVSRSSRSTRIFHCSIALTLEMDGRGRGGGGGGRKVLLPPINFIFKLLQQRSTVQIWLYEQLGIRIEGKLRVSLCEASHSSNVLYVSSRASMSS